MIIPMIMPSFSGGGGGGGGYRDNYTELDWKVAPEWAMYANTNCIGSWEWRATFPSWDTLFSHWEGKYTPALRSVHYKTRKTIKNSLHQRPHDPNIKLVASIADGVFIYPERFVNDTPLRYKRVENDGTGLIIAEWQMGYNRTIEVTASDFWPSEKEHRLKVTNVRLIEKTFFGLFTSKTELEPRLLFEKTRSLILAGMVKYHPSKQEKSDDNQDSN